MQQRVLADLVAELVALVRGRQLAVDQQPRGLEERRVLPVGEVVDVVAAVAEDAGVAVDERDRRLGRAGVHEAVVERDEPGLRAQLRDVDRALVLGAADDRELDLLVVPVQDGRRFGHRHSSGRSVGRTTRRQSTDAGRPPKPCSLACRASHRSSSHDARRAVVIPARFCGPPDRGNGGVTAGLLAAHFDGPAEVTLRRPSPLETPITVEWPPATELVLRDGDATSPRRRRRSSTSRSPAPLSLAVARAAAAASPVVVHPDWHPFPTCFVCGPGRAPRRRAARAPGRVGDSELFAAPVEFPPDLAGADGQVPAELLWAALDCPSSFVMYMGGERPAMPYVLGRIAARIDPATGDRRAARRARRGRSGLDGRKLFAASALYDGRRARRVAPAPPGSASDGRETPPSWTSTSPTTRSRCATARGSCSTASRRPRGCARTRRPATRSTRALVGDGRAGLARHRGPGSRGRRRARRGRGRGAVRGARRARRAGTVRLDGARDRRVRARPVTTAWVERLLAGDALACVAWDPAAPVPYAPSADVAVVLADDGVYAMELDRRRRGASPRWTSPASSAGSRSTGRAASPLGGADARDTAARSGATFTRGRHARGRVARARHGGRVRQGPRAVRPADRVVPGREAPLRRHARRRRGHALDRLLGRVVHRCRRPRRVDRGVDREDLVLRRVEARDGVGAAGARRHRLHLGARSALLHEARAARPARVRRRRVPPGPAHRAAAPARRGRRERRLRSRDRQPHVRGSDGVRRSRGGDAAPVAVARSARRRLREWQSDRPRRRRGAASRGPGPPTYTFVMARAGDSCPAAPGERGGSRMDACGRVRASTADLHGEQHFTYHRQASPRRCCGDSARPKAAPREGQTDHGTIAVEGAGAATGLGRRSPSTTPSIPSRSSSERLAPAASPVAFDLLAVGADDVEAVDVLAGGVAGLLVAPKVYSGAPSTETCFVPSSAVNVVNFVASRPAPRTASPVAVERRPRGRAPPCTCSCPVRVLLVDVERHAVSVDEDVFRDLVVATVTVAAASELPAVVVVLPDSAAVLVVVADELRLSSSSPPHAARSSRVPRRRRAAATPVRRVVSHSDFASLPPGRLNGFGCYGRRAPGS